MITELSIVLQTNREDTCSFHEIYIDDTKSNTLTHFVQCALREAVFFQVKAMLH